MPKQNNMLLRIPSGVEVKLDGRAVSVKGKGGALSYKMHNEVDIREEQGVLYFSHVDEVTTPMLGTDRAHIKNMIDGVETTFSKTLKIIGVGFRAELKGKILHLLLGYSHPIEYLIPEGIEIMLPSQTEVVVKGIEKQLVGQVAADIRKFRLPEPYKGKGVRYADEHIVIKKTKKKG